MNILNSTSQPRWQLIVWALGITLFASFFFAGCATSTIAHHNDSDAAPSPPSPLVGWYRGPLNRLSAVRRGPCPMHPSCSEYARQAMAKHGSIKGWVMATDRLMRCGRDETHLAPKVWVNGRVKYSDPVEKNDFWWVKK